MLHKGERKFGVLQARMISEAEKKAFDEYMQKFAETADLLVKRKYGM